MIAAGFYEQIKTDLGYLNLDAAAGSFATLAEQARSDGWTTSSSSPGSSPSKPPRTATGASLLDCATPGSPTAGDSTSPTSSSNRRWTANSSRTSPPCGSSRRTGRGRVHRGDQERQVRIVVHPRVAESVGVIRAHPRMV
jgi:hypothetical protein